MSGAVGMRGAPTGNYAPWQTWQTRQLNWPCGLTQPWPRRLARCINQRPRIWSQHRIIGATNIWKDYN